MNQTISTILCNCQRWVEKNAAAMSLIGRLGSGRQVELASGLAIIALSSNTPLLLFVQSSDRRLQFVVWISINWSWAAPRGGRRHVSDSKFGGGPHAGGKRRRSGSSVWSETERRC